MSRDSLINSLVALFSAVVMLLGIKLAAAAEPATVDTPTQTPCSFVESGQRVPSYHAVALIASRELSPQGITPEEQSCSNQPKGNQP